MSQAHCPQLVLIAVPVLPSEGEHVEGIDDIDTIKISIKAVRLMKLGLMTFVKNNTLSLYALYKVNDRGEIYSDGSQPNFRV